MNVTFLYLLPIIAMAASFQSHAPIVPDAEVFNLDEVGLYRVGYTYRGQPTREMPYGWSGHFDDPTGISCQPFGEQNGKRAFLLHCPWRGGTGLTWQEYTVALPRARRIRLEGAYAMRADIVGKSDGSTFRVFVNDTKLLEKHCKDAPWHTFSFDLTPYGGKTVRIRFENDAGPADDPSFDYSLWGERTLLLQGYATPKAPSVNRPSLSLSAVSSTNSQDVAPSGGYKGRQSVTVKAGVARLRYEGTDGVFEYQWDPRTEGLGSLQLTVKAPAAQPQVIPMQSGGRIVWTGKANQTACRLERLAGAPAAVCRKSLLVADKPVNLTMEARLIGKALAMQVKCDAPCIASMQAPEFGPVLRRRQVPVPYYGSVTYLAREGVFANRFLDWTKSAASRHSDATAYYDPLTDGTRNRLSERVLYVAAWHLAEVLPNIPNPPSPFLREVGGKIVLDVWGGRYVDIAEKLRDLHSYGLRNCLVLIHDWQRSGYDNALPMHLPAAADKGGDEGMKVLVSTATGLGYRIALHENYVDYYPNYDNFDESHIALDSSGKRVLAWYNPGTRIQSFAIQPNAILPLARTQSPEIHRRYGTNACYLDVHSAVPPWFHVDFRAGQPGAGMFRQVFEAHRALWQFERTTHGGPVFGEGNSHWYWSGLLDGVEAQFGTGWPGNMGQTAPLMVDFDLLKIHPLQINHGQGYYERWWKDLPWGAVPPLAVLDQYRLQEVLYGHIGLLGASTWSKVPYAWLEHHLLTPVTSRHAGVPVSSITYNVNGRWVDMTAAAIAGQWNRPRVAYANGLTLIGNATSETWHVDGMDLPPNGWLAHGAGVTAYTALRDGVVADYAETPTSVFANARAVEDWDLSGITPVRPTVGTFQQTGPRAFIVTYRWQVSGAPRNDYDCFVHFSKVGHDQFDESIRFQQDHGLSVPTSQWQPGSEVTDGPHSITIPGDIEDGDYEWTIGLWKPEMGRATIDGPMDSSGRILLGILRVSEKGEKLEFIPNSAPHASRPSMQRASLNENGRIVTFPTIRTNGSVLVEREEREWVLRTMPRNRPFILELNVDRFGKPSQIRCLDGDQPTVAPAASGGWWRLPMNGAREYRWEAQPQ